MNEEYDKIIYTVTSSEDPTIQFVWNWVRVKERLPELKNRHGNIISSDPVLVFNGRISVGVRWIQEKIPGICQEQEYFLSEEEEDRGNITHWMTLPNPPEK